MQYGIGTRQQETFLDKTERIIGLIMAGLLIFIIVAGICISIFSLLFRDGRGVGGLNGARGDEYLMDGRGY